MDKLKLSRPLQACLLDLDGTMVDTLGDFEAALAVMLQVLGRAPLTQGEIITMVGKGSEHLLQRALQHTGKTGEAVDDDLFQQAWRLYQGAYADINGRYSRVYSGVVEGLQELRARGLPLACLTNKPVDHARVLLQDKGLDGFFDQVFGGDSFARKKPDPLPLLEACGVLASMPAQTLMIGDSSNDALAARAAGCPVVLVRYGYNHGRDVLEIDADAHVDTLTGLAAQLPLATV